MRLDISKILLNNIPFLSENLYQKTFIRKPLSENLYQKTFIRKPLSGHECIGSKS